MGFGTCYSVKMRTSSKYSRVERARRLEGLDRGIREA